MKTSTPTNVTTKRFSLSTNVLRVEDEDIVKEIKERREEAINKSADVHRRSVAAPLIAGLTASELSQHCKDCIRLSTENKINTKNAFSFLLIDAMAAMAKKADSEINKNFQVASCTLDASVKIYGYRVDAVHTEVIKMAGGVLSKEVEDVEGNSDNVDDEKEDELKSVVKKKKRKKINIVPPESLNAKAEFDVLSDFTPHQSFLMHKTDGHDLLIKIPKFNDDGVLFINSDYTCWPLTESRSLPSLKSNDVCDPESLNLMLREITLSENDYFCPRYHDFQFGINSDQMSDTYSDEESSSSYKDNCFEFDINASVHHSSLECESDTAERAPLRERLEIPLGGYESDQEVRVAPVIEQKRTENIPISDLKNRITLNQLEYSMFDEQVLKAWAGPSFWKVGSTNQKKLSDENKENENTSRGVPSKRTRKGAVKQTIGLFDISETALIKAYSCGEKIMLNKSTMLNWSLQHVTMPSDCKYKAKNLISLFNLPSFSISCKTSEDAGEMELSGESDSTCEVKEELEYCSNLTMHGDVEHQSEVPEDDQKEEYCEAADRVEVWDEKNMVALPNRVEKISVSTFRRKKNIDIRYLKHCLWTMLRGTEGGKTEEDKISRSISFAEVMNSYMKSMPVNLASSLNAAQIFNALLHLTNEKCLVLTQDQADKSDFIISQ